MAMLFVTFPEANNTHSIAASESSYDGRIVGTTTLMFASSGDTLYHVVN